ncbi:MAG: carboxymuconolactone decarboxylase family protein [Legionellales bacterium]|nr:carboxymuconolactone decarboxylase family protein [Legionellales bacterium]
MPNKRYQQGLETMKQIHGGQAGENLINNLGEICPQITTLIIEWGFGKIMQNKVVDLKTRELAYIASLMTLGNALPQLQAHVEAALRIGATREEVIEIMTQTALCTGFPTAINAFIAVKPLLTKE